MKTAVRPRHLAGDFSKNRLGQFVLWCVIADFARRLSLLEGGTDSHVGDGTGTENIFPHKLGVGLSGDTLDNPSQDAISEIGIGVLRPWIEIERLTPHVT